MHEPSTLQVPLGIGTMFWGDTNLDEKMAGRIIPEETLVRIRDVARERDVTFFDTAEGYGVGSSEARLGRLGFAASGNLVATKFLPTLWRWTPNAFVRAARASNQRLGIEQCALSFIHSPIHPRSPRVWIRGAARAARVGTLRALGVSNFNAEQVRAAWKAAREEGVPLVANQIMFSLLVYRSERLRETVEACRELGLSIVGYGGLGQGLLTEGLTPDRLAKNRVASRMRLSESELGPVREAIAAIAQRHGKSMAQVCVQWSRGKGVIPLVGIRTVEQLENTLGALSFSLTPQEIATLDNVALGYSTFDRSMWRRGLFLTFLSLLVAGVKAARALRPPNR
ncbi:MAG TPA: aldo/keto reductase [Spirochaetia bacterium]|nr:aldo/keto reductase [Spirochaetia bacterium]